MFDIAFSELLIIGVVALLVIGPERLPKVARTAGAWMGRLNRYVSEVKGDIDREMRLDELRKLQDEMKSTAQKYELMASETGQEIKREVESVDKVIQAMSLTDGGLSLQEYEKDKAAAQAAEMAATEPAAEPASLSDAPAEPASAAAMEKDRPV
jgi:sec-independent protein translocase protein TatB